MRFGGLLTATVVLVALAIGLFFSNREKAKEAAKPPSDTNAKIISVPEGDVNKVDIKKKDSPETVLAKDNSGKWEMTAPKQYGVDQDATNSLVTSASSVSSDRVVEDKATDLGQYGLASPALEVDVTTKDGKTKKLLLGDDTPTGSGTYAMLSGDPRVFTIASYVKSALDKNDKDLRDKRLLTFDQDKVSRVELVRKNEDIEFGRGKDNWQILKPKPLRADTSQVDDLLRKLKDAKMDLSLSDEDTKKAAAAFASGAPVATVKITDPSGTEDLQVRKEKDDYYAKSSVVPGVYKVSSDLATSLDKNLDDFRNKKLFEFGFTDPSKIEIHGNGKSYAFQKSGEDWMSGGKKMDNISVQNLIDRLREIGATKFVDTGFGTPTVDISVTSADGKTVEKVEFSKSGSDYIAKRENDPSLYQVDGKSVDEILTAAGDVKPAQAPKK